jgi:allantoate deiminase
MALRHDALCAAAEWILAVEQLARKTHGLVATVGKIDSTSGAGNVISGKVEASLDVRHGGDRVREQTFESLVRQGNEIALRRGVRFSVRDQINQAATAMASALTGLVGESIRAAGAAPLSMVSGAGHDAMVMAERLPSAMIFVRSPGGISHHPDERVLVEDVQTALTAGNHFLRNLSL